MVYVEPIDETGDTVKAGGAIDVQLWDLNKKENEARLAQWQIEPNELKTLWLGGMLSSSYRLSFDAAAIVDKFDKPLTVKVNFTDYLVGHDIHRRIHHPPAATRRQKITPPAALTTSAPAEIPQKPKIKFSVSSVFSVAIINSSVAGKNYGKNETIKTIIKAGSSGRRGDGNDALPVRRLYQRLLR